MITWDFISNVEKEETQGLMVKFRLRDGNERGWRKKDEWREKNATIPNMHDRPNDHNTIKI